MGSRALLDIYREEVGLIICLKGSSAYMKRVIELALLKVITVGKPT